MRRGEPVSDPKLAPVAVQLAEMRLEMTQGIRLFVVATVLWALLLGVAILQGDLLWGIASGVLLAYFLFWLLVGRTRVRAKLERAIELNRALTRRDPTRASGARAKSGRRPQDEPDEPSGR